MTLRLVMRTGPSLRVLHVNRQRMTVLVECEDNTGRVVEAPCTALTMGVVRVEGRMEDPTWP